MEQEPQTDGFFLANDSTGQWVYLNNADDTFHEHAASHFQPHQTARIPIYTDYAGMMRGMGMFGEYRHISSPGPPIQTTERNKGPGGANLFIFYIPNHFTNADLYQLFCPYGNLVSVRIMTEKGNGRGLGYGIISYSSPSSATLAIEKLNGFAIGNKRLKVQHKRDHAPDQHRRSCNYRGVHYRTRVGDRHQRVSNDPNRKSPHASCYHNGKSSSQQRNTKGKQISNGQRGLEVDAYENNIRADKLPAVDTLSLSGETTSSDSLSEITPGNEGPKSA